MGMQTAYSTKPLAEAVREVQAVLQPANPRVVLFFASACYVPGILSREMKAAFPNACVAGCSTAGEIVGGLMLKGSLTAVALDSETVSGAAAVVVNEVGAGIDLAAPLKQLEDHFQCGRADWDIEKYVGLVLVDGLSAAEEALMEKLGDSTDVFFVGGSAGDDLEFQCTHVYVEGRALTDAAVLVLLRLERGFRIVKTQSFRTLGKTLVATAVDESRRTVLEFDHRPALDAYAAALGIAPNQAAAHFFEHPLGLMVNGEPFVRSPRSANGANIVFYCSIKQGMELELLEATDIVTATRGAIDAERAAGEIHGLIDFQCILRTMQLREEHRCGPYGAIFAGIPMAGFSTYGEAYLGHLNQTSTMLVLR